MTFNRKTIAIIGLVPAMKVGAVRMKPISRQTSNTRDRTTVKHFNVEDLDGMSPVHELPQMPSFLDRIPTDESEEVEYDNIFATDPERKRVMQTMKKTDQALRRKMEIQKDKKEFLGLIRDIADKNDILEYYTDSTIADNWKKMKKDGQTPTPLIPKKIMGIWDKAYERWAKIQKHAMEIVDLDEHLTEENFDSCMWGGEDDREFIKKILEDLLRVKQLLKEGRFSEVMRHLKKWRKSAKKSGDNKALEVIASLEKEFKLHRRHRQEGLSKVAAAFSEEYFGKSNLFKSFTLVKELLVQGSWIFWLDSEGKIAGSNKFKDLDKSELPDLWFSGSEVLNFYRDEIMKADDRSSVFESDQAPFELGSVLNAGHNKTIYAIKGSDQVFATLTHLVCETDATKWKDGMREMNDDLAVLKDLKDKGLPVIEHGPELGLGMFENGKKVWGMTYASITTYLCHAKKQRQIAEVEKLKDVQALANVVAGQTIISSFAVYADVVDYHVKKDELRDLTAPEVAALAKLFNPPKDVSLKTRYDDLQSVLKKIVEQKIARCVELVRNLIKKDRLRDLTKDQVKEVKSELQYRVELVQSMDVSLPQTYDRLQFDLQKILDEKIKEEDIDDLTLSDDDEYSEFGSGDDGDGLLEESVLGGSVLY